MSAAPVDYDVLAEKHGATPTTAASVDYDKLAEQHGGQGYKGQVTSTGIAAPQGTDTKSGAWDSLKSTVSDLGTGMAEGAANTVGSSVAGVSKLLNKIPGIGKYLAPEEGIRALEAKTAERSKPENTTQAIGRTGEQVGEFMLPTGMEGKTLSLLDKAPQIAKAIPYIKPVAKLGVQALESGLRNKSQGGDFTTGAEAGAGGELVNQGLQKAAPIVAETALGIANRMRGHGRTIGDAALNELTGVRPSTLLQQSKDKLGQLTSELEGAAGAQSGIQPRPHPIGLLRAAPTTIPLAASETGEMPGALLRAKRPAIPESAFSPEARIARGDSGISPIRLTDAEGPEAPYRYYSTSGEGEVLPPKQSEAGVMVTRDPAIANRATGTPKGRYTLQDLPPVNPASTRPALSVIDSAISKAGEKNSAVAADKLNALRQQLTTDFRTGKPIGDQITPEKILNLKRGIGDLVDSWAPGEQKGIKPIIQQIYGALDKELDRTVPEAEGLNQRISSLIPVKTRASILTNGAPTAQRIAARIARPAGALLGAGVGYHEYGIPGAVAGLAIPEMISSPTGQMFAARAMKSGAIPQLGKALALQLDRKQEPDETKTSRAIPY